MNDGNFNLETANTVTHEIGHNLGLQHDEDIVGCVCVQGTEEKCIMAATASGR